MKKLICVFLAVLLLAGCSVRPQPEESALPTEAVVPSTAPTTERTTEASPTEPEAAEPGLYELCSYTEADGYRPITVAARGSEAAVLLNRWPADPDQTTCYLQLLNLDTGEAGEILPLEGSEDDDAFRITLEADETLVFYHPYQDTAARYDRQGRLLGRVENPCPAAENPQFPHELANSRFTFQDTLAWYHSYAEDRYLFTAYAFADEPEALYLVEGGYDSVRCAEGKRLLESAYLQNNGGLSYRVLDLEAGVELDRLTIETTPSARRGRIPSLTRATLYSVTLALSCGRNGLITSPASNTARRGRSRNGRIAFTSGVWTMLLQEALICAASRRRSCGQKTKPLPPPSVSAGSSTSCWTWPRRATARRCSTATTRRPIRTQR